MVRVRPPRWSGATNSWRARRPSSKRIRRSRHSSDRAHEPFCVGVRSFGTGQPMVDLRRRQLHGHVHGGFGGEPRRDRVLGPTMPRDRVPRLAVTSFHRSSRKWLPPACHFGAIDVGRESSDLQPRSGTRGKSAQTPCPSSECFSPIRAVPDSPQTHEFGGSKLQRDSNPCFSLERAVGPIGRLRSSDASKPVKTASKTALRAAIGFQALGIGESP